MISSRYFLYMAMGFVIQASFYSNILYCAHNQQSGGWMSAFRNNRNTFQTTPLTHPATTPGIFTTNQQPLTPNNQPSTPSYEQTNSPQPTPSTHPATMPGTSTANQQSYIPTNQPPIPSSYRPSSQQPSTEVQEPRLCVFYHNNVNLVDNFSLGNKTIYSTGEDENNFVEIKKELICSEATMITGGIHPSKISYNFTSLFQLFMKINPDFIIDTALTHDNTYTSESHTKKWLDKALKNENSKNEILKHEALKNAFDTHKLSQQSFFQQLKEQYSNTVLKCAVVGTAAFCSWMTYRHHSSIEKVVNFICPYVPSFTRAATTEVLN